MKERVLRALRRRPVALVLGCACVYGLLGVLLYARGIFYYFNMLFGADVPRVVADFTVWDAPHGRTTAHPLVPLLTLPVGVPLAWLLRSHELVALALTVLAGSLAVGFAHALFRTFVSEGEALALALLYAVSSSNLALFTQPETFALAALGIVATAYAVRREAPLFVRVAASVLLVGALVTNVLHLGAAEFLGKSGDFRAKAWRTGKLAFGALAGVVVLTLLELRLVPHTRTPFKLRTVTLETAYFAHFDSLAAIGTRIADVALQFLSYAFVAPRPRFWKPAYEPFDRTTFDEAWRSGLWGHTVASACVAFAFFVLLVWTAIVLVRAGRGRTETWSIAAVIAAHVGLFFVYGDDQLLYSPVWLIELVLAIALALGLAREQGRWRPPALSLGVLALAALGSNLATFGRIYAHYAPLEVCFFPGKACAEREPKRWLRAAGAERPSFQAPTPEFSGRAELEAEMRRRPHDHFSSRAAHVLLGEPMSPVADKAYYEVGGNLSPAMGSFGVSFGTLDRGGSLANVSSDAPEQDFAESWTLVGGRPAIDSMSADRLVRTVFVGPAHLVQTITPKRPHEVVFVRGAGPAGGALWHVEQREPGVLRLNDAWTLRVTPPTRAVVGLELDALTAPPIDAVEAFDARGWAFARFEIDGPTVLELTRDGAPGAGPWPSLPSEALALHVPEPRFVRLLDASWLHLRAGITDGEVRPGDPAHYALPWLRDGAYVVAALARTGERELVARAVTEFVEHDFFGGFGAEADAPGLALWALDQATTVLEPKPFADSVWPAVERKVRLIERMRRGPLRASPEGPLLPAYEHDEEVERVADAPRDGCIVGRMDWFTPLYFVNAVSFQGLRSAARLAEARGDATRASAWRASAQDLARSCAPFAVDAKERLEARTAISAIWPTFFAKDDDDALRDGLERQWQRDFGAEGPKTVPFWTYFLVASAHQWLYLGRPERARATLAWFAEHDATRGLGAFPEGTGGSMGLWRRYRGWPRNEPIVPHYWTAAELVLLELDMLAFEDERTTPPTIVVGAGLERAWIEAGQVSFSGLRTRSAVVSLATEGGVMHVRVQARMPVRVVTSPHLSGVRVEITE